VVAGDSGSLDLGNAAEQLVNRGLLGLPLAEQLQAFCGRLRDAGLPITRVNMSVGTLHPRYGAQTFLWRRTTGEVEHTPRERSIQQLEIYRRSPIHHMRQSGETFLRRRLDAAAVPEFPVFADLRAEGVTDYFAELVLFSVASGHAPRSEAPMHLLGRGREDSLEGIFFSFATDDPGGFADGHVRQVRDALPFFALAAKARATFDVAVTLLRTYVGEDAGRRVLTGEIDRGSTQVIPAVIWLCDLRGFTRIADTVPRERLVEVLDAYLDVLARPVHEHGGQILKFLGDGFLATFDLSRLAEEAVCAEALSAAADLLAAIPRFNAQRSAAGLPVMDFGLALHRGEVLYGNIGTLDRLDFTVVGPAVNEASRIETLCRPLNRRVLVSSAFNDAAGACRGRLVSVGFHPLRHVSEPQELFTLAG